MGDIDDVLARKQIKEMAKVKLAPKEIEDCLLDSCISGDEQKLVVDLVSFVKLRYGQTKASANSCYNLVSSL